MPGLVRGVARTAVIAGTATAVSGRVSRRQQARWADQDVQQQQAAQPVPQEVVYAVPPPPASPTQDEKINQLKELAALRDQGILTPAEFEAQKAKILAG
ncbi:MAG TPA: SHOCT domain-containing protein [Candidatus Dormibacteraeota bacterium]|nr:SHOCT domain-containing protein [Candidatus Dormibacteraeota bacterium]